MQIGQNSKQRHVGVSDRLEPPTFHSCDNQGQRETTELYDRQKKHRDDGAFRCLRSSMTLFEYGAEERT